MYTYMHVTTNEKEVMNLQESTGLYDSVWKEKGKRIVNYIIIAKIKKLKNINYPIL